MVIIVLMDNDIYVLLQFTITMVCVCVCVVCLGNFNAVYGWDLKWGEIIGVYIFRGSMRLHLHYSENWRGYIRRGGWEFLGLTESLC